MKPGVTEIEFHREDADGLGWRGPGLLLKLQENGSAIVEYQGRPYLVPLRNLRMFRGSYYANYLNDKHDSREQELDAWLALRRLMESTEATVPYRIDTFGYVKNHSGKWHLLPKGMSDNQINDILEDVRSAAQFLTNKECHGIKVGVGLKKMITTPGTTGTLIAWRRRTVRMSIVDNPRGTNISTTNIRVDSREEMCYLYFYSYDPNFVEPPPDTWAPKGVPIEESPIVPRGDPPHQLPPGPDGKEATTEAMDTDGNDNKRDGPESRTVVLGPEAKKQRLNFVEPVSMHMGETFMNMHHRQHIIDYNQEPMLTNAEEECYFHSQGTHKDIFSMSSPGWFADISVGSIFRVDAETDTIEERQVAPIWPQVDEADGKEVAQFVNEDAFAPVLRSELGNDTAVIDAIWVRKWKKTVLGKIVKSRLCVRGCHDPWKHFLSNRSSTATRLSQRLILTSAANDAMRSVESWDIAGAFLKGLTYEALWKALRELGLQSVERRIAVVPPRNVWRHLRRLSKKLQHSRGQASSVRSAVFETCVRFVRSSSRLATVSTPLSKGTRRPTVTVRRVLLVLAASYTW